jgi:DNA-binding CsgD family transcriptional regulator
MSGDAVSDDGFYLRWVNVAADVLRRAPGPVDGEVCAELAKDFRAVLTAQLEVDSQIVLRPVGAPQEPPLDLAFYERLLADAPLVRDCLAVPFDDDAARSSQDASADGGPGWTQLQARLEQDGIGSWLVFPLPAQAAARSWCVLARAAAFTDPELARARAIARLVAGLARHGGGAGSTEQGRPPTVDGASVRPVLSPQELAVLTLMAQGLIARAIGRRLGVSPRTVAKHQQRIYRKFDTTDRLTTVLRAQAAGLVVSGSPGG